MKVLLSAFSCAPDRGSELEVGYRTLLAAAARHDVWLLTADCYAPVLAAALARRPEGQRVRLHPIPTGTDEAGLHRFGLAGFHWRYDRWQRQAARLAVELDRRIDFDVVHHVTLSSHWTRAGIGAVGKPFVWGPVGGGVEIPPAMLREVGFRGALAEGARFTGRRLLEWLPPSRRTQRAATVALAQNPQTAARIVQGPQVRILSHGLCVDVNAVRLPQSRTREIILSGRLIPWKAPRLAVRALPYLSTDATLCIFGAGPDRTRIERAARRLGVTSRIRFEGTVARPQLLERVAAAAAVVHPSLHDEASIAVAEALALGTPVVALDHGGPAELIRAWRNAPATAVPPTTPEETARRIAAALDGFLANPAPIPRVRQQPSPTYAEQLFDAYEWASEAGQSGSSPVS